MEYSQRNAGFPGHNAAFPGLSDDGTQRKSSEQPTAGPETGSGSFSWSGVVRPRLEEVATRENGFVLELWGGIGIVIGAVLPFIFHAQETVDGTQFAISSGIGTGRCEPRSLRSPEWTLPRSRRPRHPSRPTIVSGPS